MKCLCTKNCPRELKVIKDMERPSEVRIKIGFFWRRVNTKKLIKLLNDAQQKGDEQ